MPSQVRQSARAALSRGDICGISCCVPMQVYRDRPAFSRPVCFVAFSSRLSAPIVRVSTRLTRPYRARHAPRPPSWDLGSAHSHLASSSPPAYSCLATDTVVQHPPGIGSESLICPQRSRVATSRAFQSTNRVARYPRPLSDGRTSPRLPAHCTCPHTRNAALLRGQCIWNIPCELRLQLSPYLDARCRRSCKHHVPRSGSPLLQF